MKKLDDSGSDEPTQEQIDDIYEDLLTILEVHIESMDASTLFYHIIKYLTTTLYECAPSHSEALKVLRVAMDDGIKEFMNKKEG